MSIGIDVTRMIIHEKLREEIKFSLDELLKEISTQGGSKNVYRGVSVLDYLESLERKGFLSYNPSDNTYFVVRNFNKLN